MVKIDPMAIGFTKGFFLEENIRWVNKLNIEQLIKKRVVMTISKAMIMNIGIMFMTSRLTLVYIYYYYSTH